MKLLSPHTPSCPDKPVIPDRIFMPGEFTIADLDDQIDEMKVQGVFDSGENFVSYGNPIDPVMQKIAQEINEGIKGYLKSGRTTYQIINGIF
jgi:hypothetical protein